MAKRSFLITGANSGIGRVTAESLAGPGSRLLLCCRKRDKTESLLRRLESRGAEVRFFELDLSDLDSVRACAERVLDLPEPLDVLINNAGLAGRSELTRQGFELAFGVNHLGHFLLTERLLPKLLASAAPRVINVSSVAHFKPRHLDFERLRRRASHLGAFAEYATSKLCNVLHAKELARRYEARGLLACALHPGVVATDVWREVPQPIRALIKLGMISSERGAQTSVFCATNPSVRGGLYYERSRPREPSKLAQLPELARELWERSEQWCAA